MPGAPFNWIRLPDGNVLNANQVSHFRLVKLTNPQEQYQIIAIADGHPILLAQELYSLPLAEAVLNAILQAAGIPEPVPVSTALGLLGTSVSDS